MDRAAHIRPDRMVYQRRVFPVWATPYRLPDLTPLRDRAGSDTGRAVPQPEVLKGFLSLGFFIKKNNKNYTNDCTRQKDNPENTTEM